MPKTISTYTYSVNGITLATGDNPVTVTANGTVSAYVAGALYGPGGSTITWTIANSGLIANTNEYGIILGTGTSPVASGIVSNEGSIAGGISGGGVGISGPGLVTNAVGGSITGGQNAVLVKGGAGTVTNDGALIGTGITSSGVYLAFGGTVSNSGSGLITGGRDAVFVLYEAGTVTNSGSMTGTAGDGVHFGASGVVTNSAGSITGSQNAVYSGANAPSTVTNYASLIGSVHAGVDLEAGGTVTNSVSGTISGNDDGVVFGAGGSKATLNNNGYIIGTQTEGVAVASGVGAITNGASATIKGGYWGIYESTAGTVTNLGTIVGTNPLAANTAGVSLDKGGTVTNSGTSAVKSGAGAGVEVANASGSVDNSGTITGYYGLKLFSSGNAVNQGVVRGSGLGPAGTGVYLKGSGAISVENLAGGTISGSRGVFIDNPGGDTLTNAGTIIGNGGTAVDFTPGGATDRLIVDPGASFVGSIYGGGGIVELASGTITGALSGFGTSITNFSSLQFDPAAAWNVAGDGMGLEAIGTISGFAPGDTIEVTGVSASSGTFLATPDLFCQTAPPCTSRGRSAASATST
jgi:hypothetical protein